MINTSQKVARILLELSAISLNLKKPYRYVSGMFSPVYTDCRVLMAYPDKRKLIRDLYINAVKKSGIAFDVVAGTATAGIPHAAWIADKLNLPMVYVRDKAKDHGKENMMEGIIKKGQKAVVIEDLVSTGESAINSVNAIRAAGGQVSAVFSIITYGLAAADKNLAENDLKLVSLTDFNQVVAEAQIINQITKEEVSAILDWAKNPQAWGKNLGLE
ncbi:orotate phosphoribosyltransferase [Candidatus Daviesbacteria bacterium RIFCSPHIGHO2_02_FULL_39_12]|uniref:Orotate phosphoribosyltransferase n=2 Tax=Candidatus Daviesiibacteriota TaxID=1752718 RepID=A0A1F5J8H8_9BACT|nr:MAG: orotate phosphoribosyltransferase [Candidatus Daviesbacteria bacterium RIFCSPHIGHO2_02_FULL_39_12]OGE72286.1 MAG: orotate phosphoribosyltransferase [Candidatus Daviesbacteria bacterium RIFCSPLOWO2_02_FULL_38_15]OGI07125.1 MAG: orotate phosphoribosyltransferase [Candidatus Melainabacteria bacterium RIFCSPLOWO2_12_FULL_35_11]